MKQLHVLLALLAGAASTPLGSQAGPSAAGQAADDAASSAAPSSSGTYYCGGETTRSNVEAYFKELSKGLEQGRDRAWFNRFVKSTFSVTRDGKHTVYKLDDFVSITPRFLGPEDWRAISDRGGAAVEGAGWRGCMMDHGKVWFEASLEGDFRLRGFNHDMPWQKPSAN